MSLLQSPRRPSSDDLDPDHLHVGLDRELDLSAERPSTFSSEGKRGPGLLVAAIVTSALALAGIILLTRGEPSAAPSDAAPPTPIPEVLAAPTEPTPVVEPGSIAPVSEPIRTPSRVAAQQVPPPTLEPVPPLPPAASTAPGASIPAAIAPAAIAPAAIAPAAIAPMSPTPRAPAASSEPAPSAPVAGGSDLRLPAPVFGDPPSAPAPRPADDDADHPLPGVEEPSIFEPADDPEDDELPEEPSLPSSTTARDALEAIDGMLGDEPALDAPAA